MDGSRVPLSHPHITLAWFPADELSLCHACRVRQMERKLIPDRNGRFRNHIEHQVFNLIYRCFIVDFFVQKEYSSFPAALFRFRENQMGKNGAVLAPADRYHDVFIVVEGHRNSFLCCFQDILQNKNLFISVHKRPPSSCPSKLYIRQSNIHPPKVRCSGSEASLLLF